MRQYIPVLCFALLAADPAGAQVTDQMLPTEIKQLTAITEPATLRKGFFRTGLVYQYAAAKSIFNEDGERFVSPGNILSFSRSVAASLQYGISDRLQANLYVPYIFDYIEQSLRASDPLYQARQVFYWEQHGKGLGDIQATLAGQLLTEKENTPSVTARITYEHPTGRKDPTNIVDANNYDLPTGNGEPNISLDLQVRKIMYPYSFVFLATTTVGFGGNKVHVPDGESLPFKSGLLYGLNGGFNFHLNDWLSLANDFWYIASKPEEIDGIKSEVSSWHIAYNPFLHVQVKQFRLVQSVRFNLAGRYYTASPDYIVILQYVF